PQDLSVALGIAGDLGVGLECDGARAALGGGVEVLAERAAEPGWLEVRGPKLEDQCAEFLECLLRGRLQFPQVLPCRRRVTTDERRCGFGGQHEAEELLADGVVELEREAISLREDRYLSPFLLKPPLPVPDPAVRPPPLPP